MRVTPVLGGIIQVSAAIHTTEQCNAWKTCNYWICSKNSSTSVGQGCPCHALATFLPPGSDYFPFSYLLTIVDIARERLFNFPLQRTRRKTANHAVQDFARLTSGSMQVVQSFLKSSPLFLIITLLTIKTPIIRGSFERQWRVGARVFGPRRQLFTRRRVFTSGRVAARGANICNKPPHCNLVPPNICKPPHYTLLHLLCCSKANIDTAFSCKYL